MNILIVGGTRNMGYYATRHFYDAGHTITLLNRGMSHDELPADIERLRADRTDADAMREALRGRTFDVVIDMVLYTGDEAQTMVELLHGNVGHYIFISTGQVYLVRKGLQRPYSEADYEGAVTAEPDANSYDHPEWLYGYDKRQAEDMFAQAWHEKQFPYTSLRLPMVNSERDPFSRLFTYILRINDGGPILIPETPDFPLRHVYGRDVVQAIQRAIDKGASRGEAYNISQDETVSIDEFLAIVGESLGREPRLLRVARDVLDANGFLPGCSPFSERWMSELTNERSKTELGMTYTPLREYLPRIVAHYQRNPPHPPASYSRRRAEQSFAAQLEK
ncbi:MAG: NAD-dependent epimerase/dehydratase family protein [Chloroflexi bacterium]|nr:MAG: NAD-dependent epimerase/dehydratase family protein [Chloroflexota bacterium]